MNSSTGRLIGWIAVFSLIAAGWSGCATTSQPPQNYLSDIDYVGQKSVKYLVRPNPVVKAGAEGGGKKVALTDIKVQICDVSDRNDATNCTMSPILGAVTRGSLREGENREQEGLTLSAGLFKDETTVRALDSLYWYDDRTLFVAYRVSGSGAETGGADVLTEPKVKRCRLQSDNSLQCEENATINRALYKQKTTEM